MMSQAGFWKLNLDHSRRKIKTAESPDSAVFPSFAHFLKLVSNYKPSQHLKFLAVHQFHFASCIAHRLSN